MIKSKLIYFIFSITLLSAQDKTLVEDLIDQKRIELLRTKPDYSKIIKSKDDSGNRQFLIQTIKKPKFIFNCATSFPLTKKGYNKGRVFLLSFKAKTVSASLETGEAKALFIFKQLKNYKGNIAYTQSFSSEWETYYLPFEADRDISEKDIAIVMQYGFKEQSFLIKDIKFEVFKEGTTLDSLPKTDVTYYGMEQNAQWRIEANKRIDTIRKGDFTVQFFKNGHPLDSININLRLINHDYQLSAMVYRNL